MSVDIQQVIRSLSPAKQRILGVTGAALIVTFVVAYFCILPKREELQVAQKANEEQQQIYNRMKAEIAETDKIKAKCLALKGEWDCAVASGVLEPLLGSFAMRGKSLLDPLAKEAGFTIEKVRELSWLQLQLPKIPPEQTIARQPIEFTGMGSYQQIVTFIDKAEKAQPFMTLHSLQIFSQQVSPEIHRVVVAFEWPVKGDKIVPLPNNTKKK